MNCISEKKKKKKHQGLNQLYQHSKIHSLPPKFSSFLLCFSPSLSLVHNRTFHHHHHPIWRWRRPRNPFPPRYFLTIMGMGRPPRTSPSPPVPPTPPHDDIEKGTRKTRHKSKIPPPPPPPKPWKPWLMPLVFVANIWVFIYTMYVNDCPHTSGTSKCFLYEYLGRYSFQRFKENPLLGPSYIT